MLPVWSLAFALALWIAIMATAWSLIYAGRRYAGSERPRDSTGGTASNTSSDGPAETRA